MAGRILIHFHEELNDFLPPERRDRVFAHPFRENGSIKDLIESLGVPHPEIDLIFVNGQPVDFQYQVRDGDEVRVYPRLGSSGASTIRHLSPPLPRPIRFVLDTHLGRLAAYLRMTGFDTLYRNDYDDPTLARISADEHRVLLSCDRGLLMRRNVVHGCSVRDRQPRRQLTEIIDRFRLKGELLPFTRCMSCNGLIRIVDRDTVAERLPPRIRTRHVEFGQCEHCGKLFWKGSHYERMQALIEAINGAP